MRRSKKSSRKVHFRLHAMGWIFLIITTTIGMGAVKTEASLMYLVFGAMLGAVLASAMVSRRMVGGVLLRRDVSQRAWQNQTVHLGYNLRNIRKRGSCLGIRVLEVAPEGIQSASGYCVNLPPRQSFRAGARFVSRQRGRISLEKILISTTFPFGFLEAHRHYRQRSEIVIWPARGKLRRQVLDRGAVQASTAAPSPVSGGQDEFFGLREYRQDDNPRWIHWRKSAGQLNPVVREMSHPMPEELWIALDTYCPETGGAFMESREKLLRFAATLIDHAMSKAYQVGMVLAYRDHVTVLRSGAGKAHRCALLDALANVDLNTRITLPQAMSHLRPSWLSKAQFVVIWPQATEANATAARALRPSCRSFSAYDLNRLSEVFEDNPLSIPPEEAEAGGASEAEEPGRPAGEKA